jgi:hypothetical protein
LFGELVKPTDDRAGEANDFEVSSHRQHSEARFVVRQRPPRSLPGDDLDDSSRCVDHGQDAVLRIDQRRVQSVGELARITVGRPDEDGRT